MTILTDAPRQHDYVGNGATTAYAYTFLIFAATDLRVSQDDVLLTLNTHYTVTGVGQFTGGTVTMVIPPPDGSTLTIRSDVPITQGTSFPEGYRFPGRTVEATLDRLTVIARQFKDRLRHGLLSLDTETALDLTLPPPAVGKILGWKTDLTGLENQDKAPIGLTGPVGPTGPPGAGASPTVREADGTPSVAVPTVIEFAGAVVTEPSAGVALVTIPAASSVPPGLMGPYAGGTVPLGWLLCDGTAVSRTTFAALFAAIGVVWGVGDGTATFNLPPGAGRFVLGAGVGAGLTLRSLGATGGEETHVLTIAEIPSHQHGQGFAHIAGDGVNSVNIEDAEIPREETVVNDLSGGNGAHNNMPPWFAAQWIIKT